jgi:hypothetical protein
MPDKKGNLEAILLILSEFFSLVILYLLNLIQSNLLPKYLFI